MSGFDQEEIEQAFRRFWQVGAVGEDWDAWAERFTVDATYVEHVLGTLHGREAIRAWIKPIMNEYPELYTVYEWHTVDAGAGESSSTCRTDAIIRAERESSDFPGVTLLDYAGGGLWNREEDFWAVPTAIRPSNSMRPPAKRMTRITGTSGPASTWGRGPVWTRGRSILRDRPGSPSGEPKRRARARRQRTGVQLLRCGS